MRKTGISRPTTLTEADFVAFRDAGIDYLEISPSDSEYPDLHLPQLAVWAKAYGITLWSFHLPFYPPHNIADLNETARLFAVKDLQKLIAEAANVGIRNFIIHASYEPIDDADRPIAMEQAKRSLRTLAEFAASLDRVIAVEDLPRSCLGNCSADILELISCDTRLRVCFDTNHLLTEDIPTFIRAVAPYILTTHISDYDFINERHWLPGEGDIPWETLMDTLDEVGYDGPILYEVKMQKEWDTMVREHAPTPADFSRNHMELEKRAPLTVFGQRVPNLGMWGPKNS